MKRDQLKENALTHTEAMDRLYSEEIKKSIEGTNLYEIDFIRNETAGRGAEFLLEQAYTQESVARNAGRGKTAVLNFASYRHPGGGFLNGSMAQEEAICHASFLYNVLREFPEYYEW
ncbi:MAG: TIGR02452 family protein, partial [Butyrivibrio sp.]|nr:TIGR02452 family protein [Butyrivibrio sp.]